MNSTAFKKQVIFSYMLLVGLFCLILNAVTFSEILSSNTLLIKPNFQSLISFVNFEYFLTTSFAIFLIYWLSLSILILYPAYLLAKTKISLKSLKVLCISLSSVWITYALIDKFTFESFQFHLDFHWLKLFFSSELISMLNPSKLEVVIIVTAIIFIILFNLILFKIARYLSSAATIHQKSIHTFFWFWVIIIGWLYFHLQTTVMNNDKFILSQMDYYPGFQKIVLVLERRANNPSISSFHALIRAQHNKKIKYPSDEDIQLNSLTSRYNILWIVIDTLRYDAISPTLTPNIFEFQKHAINFTNHQSSGNSTQAGVFGMFYGLPPSYFPATIQHHQEPLLMKLLEKSNYDINIFYSGNLELPPWKLNLFSQRKKIKFISIIHQILAWMIT